MTPQERGRQFETNIHNFLLKTNKVVLREKDIKHEHGGNISGIDHFIDCGTYGLCIQDKLQKIKITTSQVGHFICCVNNLSKKIGKKCIGIFITNKPFSPFAEKQILDENNTNHSNNFDIIYDDNFNILCDKIMCYFYKKHIWFYEPNGDSVMIDWL
jgi:hypothetical protein